MAVDGAVVGLEGLAEDALAQLASAEHRARSLGERGEQVELDTGEGDIGIVATDLAGVGVDGEVEEGACGVDARVARPGAAGSAPMRATSSRGSKGLVR